MAQVPGSTEEDVGLLESTLDVEPWVQFESIRAAGDIVWDPGTGAWLVSSYELIKEMSMGEDTVWESVNLPSASRSPAGMGAEAWADFMCLRGRNVILRIHGDAHLRAHRWWMKALSPTLIDEWRDAFMTSVMNAQISSFIKRGRAELSDEFADKVATRVIAGVLGIPVDDAWIAEMQRLSAARTDVRQHIADPMFDEGLLNRANTSTAEMYDLLLPIVAERESGAGSDFVSVIWRGAPELFGENYDVSDIVGTVAVAWEAGASTTSASIANAIHLLLDDRSLQEELRTGGADGVRRFSEESFRLGGPLMFRPKFAVEDTQLGGVAIRKGEMAIAITAAGNRDPERYRCPADVDLGRPAARDHFSFWRGRRICAGQALGRAITEEAIAVVLHRLPGVHLDPEAPPPTFDGLISRRWSPLHVVFPVDSIGRST